MVFVYPLNRHLAGGVPRSPQQLALDPEDPSGLIIIYNVRSFPVHFTSVGPK